MRIKVPASMGCCGANYPANHMQDTGISKRKAREAIRCEGLTFSFSEADSCSRRRRRRTSGDRSWRPFPFNKQGVWVEISICHVMMATPEASCYTAEHCWGVLSLSISRSWATHFLRNTENTSRKNIWVNCFKLPTWVDSFGQIALISSSWIGSC